jgi:hypothetical protein
MRDPIVKEVRKQRMAHTRKFKGDLDAICADLKSVEQSSGHKVVRLKPRKIKGAKAEGLSTDIRG